MRWLPASLRLLLLWVLLPVWCRAADLAGSYLDDQSGTPMTIEVAPDGTVRVIVVVEGEKTILAGKQTGRGGFTASVVTDAELNVGMRISGTLSGDAISGELSMTFGETVQSLGKATWRRSNAAVLSARASGRDVGRRTPADPTPGGEPVKGEVSLVRNARAGGAPVAFTPPGDFLLYWAEDKAVAAVRISRTGALDQDHFRVSANPTPRTLRRVSAEESLDLTIAFAKASGKTSMAQRVKNSFWDGAVVYSQYTLPSGVGSVRVVDRAWLMVVGDYTVNFNCVLVQDDGLGPDEQKAKDEEFAAIFREMLLSVRRID